MCTLKYRIQNLLNVALFGFESVKEPAGRSQWTLLVFTQKLLIVGNNYLKNQNTKSRKKISS